MDADAFETLAMRVLTGDASARERAEFEQALAQNPALREEFAELQAAREAYREFGPLAEAHDTAPAPLPAEQIEQLHQAVARSQGKRAADGPCPQPPRTGEPARGHFLLRLWPRAALTKTWLAAAAIVILFAAGFLLSRFTPSAANTSPVAYFAAVPTGLEVERGGRSLPATPAMALLRGDRITVPAGTEAQFITMTGLVRKAGPVTFRAQELVTTPSLVKQSPAQSVLFQPLHAVIIANPLITQRSVDGVALYSPRAATANLTPLIFWKSQPGKTWDITITDEYNRNNPPWRATNQISPVAFTSVAAWKDRPLAASGLYKIILRETGNPSPFAASEFTFTTLPTATSLPPATPAEAFLRAWQAARAEPACLGDILAALAALPPELQSAEPALRLKLFACAQMGLKDEHDAVAARLRAIVTR